MTASSHRDDARHGRAADAPGRAQGQHVGHDGRRRVLLAIDTATSRCIVATASPSGRLDGVTTWPAGHRHGATLLPTIGSFLGEQNVRRSRLAGIIVGTGPGAFTGLRVGLATAKTLAATMGLPLVGVSTAEAILAAARGASDRAAANGAGGAPSGVAGPASGGAGPAAGVAGPAAGIAGPAAGIAGDFGAAARGGLVLLLPAGPSDRVVVRAGEAPRLVPGGVDPLVGPDETLVAIDLPDRAPAAALVRGELAWDGFAAALVRLGVARLARGDLDDPAGLVPEYVTLPRGIATAGGEVTWSRDPR